MMEIAFGLLKGCGPALMGVVRFLCDPMVRTIVLVIALGLALLWRSSSLSSAAADLSAFKSAARATFTKERDAFLTERGLLLAERKARGTDSKTAADDAKAAAGQCRADVAETRRADNAIHRLINPPEAPHDGQSQVPAPPSPGRVYGDDELCRVLGATCS